MRFSGLIGAILLLGLAACGEGPTEAQPDPARPVRVLEISGGGGGSLRSFPARIGASQRAELAFRVSGRVQELAVREGDLVAEGQLLARLDPTDLELVVRDRQARYDNAKRNFDRAQELIAGGNISKLDFDTMETEFKTADTDLDKARQDLEYSVLRAPFVGTITRRFVEQFEEVRAKQTILNLQNLSVLEVKLDVTEGLVRTIRAAPDDPRRDVPPAHAEFEDVPDARFPLMLKETANEADPQTQTFEVTFTMSAPEDFRVLPGMTATVKVDFQGILDVPSAYWIPAAAVVGDRELGARVWLFEDGQSSSVPVIVGRLEEDRIEVLEGLREGDRVITLGAAFLAEGMKVFPMAESEQAVPRADDPV